MRILIHNRQRRFQPYPARLRELLHALVPRLRRARPAVAWHELALILTDDRSMAAANRAAMGRAEPTDVLAFEYAALPGGPDGPDAELAVNLERAWTVGARYGHTPSEELARYVAHGCDHLCGYDDDTPAARRQMGRRERRWLRALACGTLFRPRRTAGRAAPRSLPRRAP